MGAIKSIKKYIILYGDSASGKTLFLYNLKSSINTFGVINRVYFQDIQPTEGFNYEEVTIGNNDFGIFDLSGDPSQYQLIDVITKFVQIVGVIFFFRMENIQTLEKSKNLLKIILNNQYLSGISLFVLYNKIAQDNDKYAWITLDLLNKKINLEELKRNYNLKYIGSDFFDCAICFNRFDDNVLKKLENFAASLL